MILRSYLGVITGRFDSEYSDRGSVKGILPGLVAFGIDFYTGAIYLPPDVTKGEGPFIEDPDAPPDPEEAEQDAAFETRPE